MSTLYEPSRCTGNLPEEFGENHVAEEKMDGSRYVLYIGDNLDPYGRQESHTLLSRRISSVDEKHVDKTLNIPHITDQLYKLNVMGCVLDGEIFRDDFQTTQSIMGSGHQLAISKQENGWTDRKTGRTFAPGWVEYHAWDIMQFRGKDVRGMSLDKRRKILLEVIDRLENPYIKPIDQFTDNFEEHFHRITSVGGEGLIIKDLRMGYGTGWAKMKKAYEVTCMVDGFTEGNGKYAGMVGALLLSVLHEGKMVPIGKASGFDDATRQHMTENQDDYLGRCVDINTMRLNKPNAEHPYGRLFQPTFHRWRDDYNPSEATLAKLKADLSKKAKSDRRKFA